MVTQKSILKKLLLFHLDFKHIKIIPVMYHRANNQWLIVLALIFVDMQVPFLPLDDIPLDCDHLGDECLKLTFRLNLVVLKLAS